MRSPGSTIRKNSPSAASTSDDSDGVVYTDNLDYKKKALLSSVITPVRVVILVAMPLFSCEKSAKVAREWKSTAQLVPAHCVFLAIKIA